MSIPFSTSKGLKPSLFSISRIHEKVETFERSDDEHFSKAAEDFMGRAKKLEDVLTRYVNGFKTYMLT